jgi:hemerythrin-like metal-binding protein
MGIPEIDSQHRFLVELANRVIVAVRTQQGAKLVGAVVKLLREYTVEHFRDEEVHMQKRGYPKLSEHHLEHERLKNQVRQWQRDLYTNRNVTAADVLAFMRSWLLEHILRTDMAFKAWLAGRGV